MQPHEWTTNDFKGDPGIDYCHDKLLFANSLHTLPERMIGAHACASAWRSTAAKGQH